MTTGKEIVDEFHKQNFHYESMFDEWLAKRIDEAISAALETSKRQGIMLDATAAKVEFARSTPSAPKKQKVGRK